MKAQHMLILDRFKEQNVLVIGDFILDRYIDGNCSRLAPEASIPVIDVGKEQSCLGGAANVAANLQQLGATVAFITLIGQDEAAKTAITLLKEKGISSLFLHFSETCSTLTKTRILKDGQLLFRLDVGKKMNALSSSYEALLTDIEKAYKKCDAVFISDYGKGTINGAIISLLTRLRKNEPKVFVIDAKDYEKYKKLSPDIIKPNYAACLALVGESQEADRVKQALKWSKILWEETHAKKILVSMDEDGVVVNDRNMSSFHHAAYPVTVKNASGAGDTFLASFLLAHLSGASDYTATQIACQSAAIAIGNCATASCKMEDLRYQLLLPKGKVLSHVDDLKCIASSIGSVKKIVFTNGCFDIFHSGHAHYLKQAKQYGDILIVGINTDESITRLKGDLRPVNLLHDRLEVLKAMEYIDYIIPFGTVEDDTPIAFLKALCPHVFVKGEEYKGVQMAETSFLESINCQIEFVPFIPHQSTTKIIDRVQKDKKVVLKKIS